ncbi:interleukin-15 receptor subunit alpha isoform X2 [Parambassis ranga]|uniref:Interleukin-15 receptor subunit alpha isoform X2 n=1 Tax=Parambassis ranga TaxID=210632 RepID=A0A6P7HWN8_9TELE|nr:interleukin-15 receptor subunit alpha isoform X2 [Parambassis ranga]
MAMGSLRLSVCVMMHLLLGASKPSSGDQNHCPCPKIPQRVLTKPPPETCYEVNSPYRYECLDGYVRKVGTSNLLKCRRDEDKPSYWTSPTLECIPDPRIVTTQPPTSTTNLNPRILTNHPADNTVTTATPTTVQTTRSLSTLASVEGETASTEPNPSGESNTALFCTDKSSVTPPVVQTTKSSTFSTGTTGSSVISTPAPFKGVAEAASATVSLVIVCAVIGIICLLYRRRRSENNKKQLPGEEATPMNVVSPEQQ